MDITAYMVWFITIAVATTAILTLGTLAAADLLPRPGGRRPKDAMNRDERGGPHDREGETAS